MLNIIKYPQRKDWEEILRRPAIDSSSLENSVSAILKDVKESGDSALRKYSLRFDKVELNSLEVSKEEFTNAEKKVSKELKQAIQLAKRNIEKFHLAQKEKVKVILRIIRNSLEHFLLTSFTHIYLKQNFFQEKFYFPAFLTSLTFMIT